MPYEEIEVEYELEFIRPGTEFDDDGPDYDTIDIHAVFEMTGGTPATRWDPADPGECNLISVKTCEVFKSRLFGVGIHRIDLDDERPRGPQMWSLMVSLAESMDAIEAEAWQQFESMAEIDEDYYCYDGQYE